MKKIVAFLLLVTLLFSMVACSGPSTSKDSEVTTSGTETPDVPEIGYDGSAVTIKFYHTMGSNLKDVLEAYIAEFNKIYPNITIDQEQVGGYDDVKNQINTQLTVGAQPNIAYCYPDHVAGYNIAHAVATLDDYIDSKVEVKVGDHTEILGLTDEQKADFIEGYYNEGKQFGDGKMYTMPLSKSTEVLYYNKTFFEANKLQVPTTWDELEAVCKKIKEIDPKSTPLGYDSEANWFITMCEQLKSPYTSAEDGKHYLFNNDQNKAFVKRFQEWYDKGYLTTQSLYGSYTSGLFVSTTEIKSYMSIGSSAGATHQRPAANADGTYPFEVGIASIPQIDPNNRKVISQGPSLCIFKKANQQEVAASWLFVKFLTTNVEFQAEFSMTSGYVPVIKSVADNEAYKAFLDKANGGSNVAALSAKVCLEQQDAYYTSPAFNGSSEARTQVGLLLTKCLALKGNDIDSQIASAFEDAVEECEYKE